MTETVMTTGLTTEDGARHWSEPYDHVGDLYASEPLADTAKRIRAHLKQVFPEMVSTTRTQHFAGGASIDVSIRRHLAEDLTQREAGSRVKRLVETELDRFRRYEWWPYHGFRAVSHYSNVAIDAALHASAPSGAPDLKPVVSFSDFTRIARPGDILEHVAGVAPTQGLRVAIVSVSSRRLTTKAEGLLDAPTSRCCIQGGACFTCDGELICFRHSGFAHQGGYSLIRWVRTAGERTVT